MIFDINNVATSTLNKEKFYKFIDSHGNFWIAFFHTSNLTSSVQGLRSFKDFRKQIIANNFSSIVVDCDRNRKICADYQIFYLPRIAFLHKHFIVEFTGSVHDESTILSEAKIAKEEFYNTIKYVEMEEKRNLSNSSNQN